MFDPNTDAERDRAEAERLRWEERNETDPNIRRDFERAARDYDAEATDLENSVADEENPE